jgi:cytochrome bd ubiquinol oxidase subunit II
MIEQLDYKTLQHLWWLICAVVGLPVSVSYLCPGRPEPAVAGGQNQTEKDLVINSLGRKWEITFTTLVLFGGACSPPFPNFTPPPSAGPTGCGS